MALIIIEKIKSYGLIKVVEHVIGVTTSDKLYNQSQSFVHSMFKGMTQNLGLLFSYDTRESYLFL
jgi:hypothetical protein